MQEYIYGVAKPVTAHPGFPVDRKLNLLVQEYSWNTGGKVWYAGDGSCFLHLDQPLSSYGEIT